MPKTLPRKRLSELIKASIASVFNGRCFELRFVSRSTAYAPQSAARNVAYPGSQRVHLPPPATAKEVAASNQFQSHMDRALEELPEKRQEVPTSLLPRARTGFDEAVAPQPWWLKSLVASASVALVCLVFPVAQPRRVTPETVAKQCIIAVQASVGPQANANTERIPPMDTRTVSGAPSHSYAARNSTNPHSAESGNPEILVPPDERIAFARLVTMPNERNNVGTALLSQTLVKKDALLSIDAVKDLE